MDARIHSKVPDTISSSSVSTAAPTSAKANLLRQTINKLASALKDKFTTSSEPVIQASRDNIGPSTTDHLGRQKLLNHKGEELKRGESASVVIKQGGVEKRVITSKLSPDEALIHESQTLKPYYELYKKRSESNESRPEDGDRLKGLIGDADKLLNKFSQQINENPKNRDLTEGQQELSNLLQEMNTLATNLNRKNNSEPRSVSAKTEISQADSSIKSKSEARLGSLSGPQSSFSAQAVFFKIQKAFNKQSLQRDILSSSKESNNSQATSSTNKSTFSKIQNVVSKLKPVKFETKIQDLSQKLDEYITANNNGVGLSKKDVKETLKDIMKTAPKCPLESNNLLVNLASKVKLLQSARESATASRFKDAELLEITTDLSLFLEEEIEKSAGKLQIKTTMDLRNNLQSISTNLPDFLSHIAKEFGMPVDYISNHAQLPKKTMSSNNPSDEAIATFLKEKGEFQIGETFLKELSQIRHPSFGVSQYAIRLNENLKKAKSNPNFALGTDTNAVAIAEEGLTQCLKNVYTQLITHLLKQPLSDNLLASVTSVQNEFKKYDDLINNKKSSEVFNAITYIDWVSVNSQMAKIFQSIDANS